MTDDRIVSAAATWHARQGADDLDWSAFEAWLNDDPRHREAFDDIALLDTDIDHHAGTLRRLLPIIGSEPSASPRSRWRHGLIGGGMAVAAAALVLVVARQEPASSVASSPLVYRAAATPRDVQIADARVTMAPGSTITTAGTDRTRLALNGRAIFTVVHDPSRTLLIRAEGYEIRDIGTRFEVVTGGGAIRVRVDEGIVEVRAAGGGGPPMRIGAGLTATGLADGRIVTGPAGPSVLEGWRSGPLVYDAMPLRLVAADVSRASGRLVVADPDVANRPFSGILAAGRGDAMVHTLATLAGLDARRQGETIHLGNRASR